MCHVILKKAGLSKSLQSTVLPKWNVPRIAVFRLMQRVAVIPVKIRCAVEKIKLFVAKARNYQQIALTAFYHIKTI